MCKVFLVLLAAACSSQKPSREKRLKHSLQVGRLVEKSVEGLDWGKLQPIRLLLLSPIYATVQCGVCNRGGDGACSFGAGDKTIAALQFLSPPDGPEIVARSCLARCEKAVPVMLPSGEIVDSVNGPLACADVLRNLGYSVDKRLVDAYVAAEEGDEKAAAGCDSQALTLYKRAFSLALGGIGLSFRSRPSVIRFLQEARAARIRALQNSTILEGLSAQTGDVGFSSFQTDRKNNNLQRVSGFGQLNFENPVSTRVTRVQVFWMARVMIRRSQAYSRLARPTADAPLGRKYALGRALDDARYALQIAETWATTKNIEPVLAQGWGRLAESYEGLNDVRGAIFAYEKLLAYEPRTTPGLPPSIVTKRIAQELVLVSHRRGLEDTTVVSNFLQDVGEESRQALTARAIDDVEVLRRRADGDVELLASLVRNDLDNLESFILRVESIFSIASPEEASYTNSKALSNFNSFAGAALSFIETLRNKTRYQFNKLELTLLRGDPLLALIRDLIRDNFPLLQQRKRGSLGAEYSQASSEEKQPPDTDLRIWLREIAADGALPQDQLLIENLVEETKRNPELVLRLVSEAAEGRYDEEATPN